MSVDINALEGWLVKKKNRCIATVTNSTAVNIFLNSKKVFGADVKRWFKIEKVTGEVICIVMCPLFS